MLYWAAAQNHQNVLRVLLKDPRTEKLFDVCDRGNNFPLHVAAKKGYLSIVMDLIEAGSEVDKKNEDEQTPLHLAAKEGRIMVCKEILKNDKYAINDDDCENNTALHLACRYGHSRVVSALINAGADIVARNYYLWTPMDCAAAYGQPKCVKILIEVRFILSKT